MYCVYIYICKSVYLYVYAYVYIYIYQNKIMQIHIKSQYQLPTRIIRRSHQGAIVHIIKEHLNDLQETPHYGWTTLVESILFWWLSREYICIWNLIYVNVYVYTYTYAKQAKQIENEWTW